jgi:hypothetical protein
MAVEGETTHEIKPHEQSYSAFASMMKWGTIISFITAMVVLVIISS